MDVYSFLLNLNHSIQGLNEHEMTWFFKRGIPLSSITFSRSSTLDNITAIFDMVNDSGHSKSVKHIHILPGRTISESHCTQVLQCTGLETLHLNGCEVVFTEAFMTQLGQRCPKLTTLLRRSSLYRKKV